MKPEDERYCFCEKHEELYDSVYWSCCEKCWNELSERSKHEQATQGTSAQA